MWTLVCRQCVTDVEVGALCLAVVQVVMVGECLARFGTAEFSERSNSSRAINTKDYATLLTQVGVILLVAAPCNSRPGNIR